MEFEELLNKITVDAMHMVIATANSDDDNDDDDANPNQFSMEKIISLKNIDIEANILRKLFVGDKKTIAIFKALEPSEKHELLNHLANLSFMLSDDGGPMVDEHLGPLIALCLDFNHRDLAKKFPPVYSGEGKILAGKEVEYSIEPYFSAIDHAISQASDPKHLINRLKPAFDSVHNADFEIEDYFENRLTARMEGSLEKTEQFHYQKIYALIHLGIDIRNICAETHCDELRPDKPYWPKTTLQFAMDCGLDKIVSLLISYGAHKNTHPWAVSALEYAMILNRPDYIEKLYNLDPDYYKKTITQPSLSGHSTLRDFCASLNDNEKMMETLAFLDQQSELLEQRIKEEAEAKEKAEQERALEEPTPNIAFGRFPNHMHFIHLSRTELSSIAEGIHQYFDGDPEDDPQAFDLALARSINDHFGLSLSAEPEPEFDNELTRRERMANGGLGCRIL